MVMTKSRFPSTTPSGRDGGLAMPVVLTCGGSLNARGPWYGDASELPPLDDDPLARSEGALFEGGSGFGAPGEPAGVEPKPLPPDVPDPDCPGEPAFGGGGEALMPGIVYPGGKPVPWPVATPPKGN